MSSLTNRKMEPSEKLNEALKPIGARQWQAAFTLVELLVVIVLIGVWAALLGPALAKTRPTDQAVQCRNNLRQLTGAWSMYAADNNQILLASSAYFPLRTNWVAGWLDFSSNPSNWDITQDIVKSPIWSYLGSNSLIFRCPSDPSTVLVSGQRKPRVRSYSMSHVFGNGYWLPSAYWRTYTKQNEIVLPAKTFLFLDEHADSINDGEFANSINSGRIVDMPGSFHYNGACGISFADSHVETHEWLGMRIKPPYYGNGNIALNVTSADSANDVSWLAQNTTVAR